MHLDNINHGGNRQQQGRGHGPKKDAQKKQNGPETRSCYSCGKPGHLSKNCRSKNKVIRQVNMIQTSGNEEEWEVVTPPESEIADPEPSPPNSDDEDLLETMISKVRQQPAYIMTPREQAQLDQYLEKSLRDGAIEKGPTYTPAQEEEFASYMSNLLKEWREEKLLDEGTLARITDLHTGNNAYKRNDAMTQGKESDPGHPGQRVKTVWDYEDSDKENQDPESPQYWHDNTGRTFYTPPDSPTLKREDATLSDTATRRAKRQSRTKTVYANDGQALILNPEPSQEEQDARKKAWEDLSNDSWRYTAEEVIQRRQVDFRQINALTVADEEFPQDYAADNESRRANRKRIEKLPVADTPLSRVPQYNLDPRNPLHELMSWTACFHDTCRIHFSEKEGSGYFPSRRSKCRWHWEECQKHECERHLWDKRAVQHFPGLDQEPGDQFLVNEKCTNDIWQTCMRSRCIRHKDAKTLNGFLPREIEKDESFLGKRLAPGVSPGVVMLPTPTHSSHSE